MKQFFAAILLVVSTFNVFAAPLLSPTILSQVSQAVAKMDTQLGPFTDDTRVPQLARRLNVLDTNVKVTSKLEMNAFYFPGTIYVGTEVAGLSDAAVAFAIAHEYGHHTRAHWKVNLLRGLALASEHEASPSFELVDGMAVLSDTPQASQARELEADYVGVFLVSDAGLYDEAEIVKLFVHLEDVDSDATHPTHEARLKQIREARKAWLARK